MGIRTIYCISSFWVGVYWFCEKARDCQLFVSNPFPQKKWVKSEDLRQWEISSSLGRLCWNPCVGVEAEFLDSVTDSRGDLGQTINSLCLGCIVCYTNISLVSVTEILWVLIVYEVFLDWHSITEVENARSQRRMKHEPAQLFILSINKEEW